MMSTKLEKKCFVKWNMYPYSPIGIELDGTRHTYRAVGESLYVRFKEETQRILEEFHDNVHSAKCICIPPEYDRCPDTFYSHPNAACILYDDERCDGQEGMKEMGNGETTFDIRDKLNYDIESVSVRQGCQLAVDTGLTVAF